MTSGSAYHRLAVDDGLELTCSTLGAAITRLRVPFAGELFDTVLSYPRQVDYETDAFYVGAMCGRYAGRISNASFTLGNRAYPIDVLPGEKHALHGGATGFNQRQWTAGVVTGAPIKTSHRSSLEPSAEPALTFTLHSPDGDQGFPGNLKARVTYRIVGKRTLLIDVSAECDQDTVLNLVNHAYFNLNQDGASIDNHSVQVVADAVTDSDLEGIPTGKLKKIKGGPLDLRAALDANGHSPKVSCALGERRFDHNFVLSKPAGAFDLAAVVSVPEHALALAVHTTLPGLQVYTADQLGGALAARAGLCLEAQQFPDAPNQPAFPSTLLRQGESFRSRTAYTFGELNDILALTDSTSLILSEVL